MNLYLCVCLLVAAYSAHCGGTDQCPASQVTSITLSLASRRNSTGHWTIEVSSGRMDPRQTPQSSVTLRAFGVDINQRNTVCNQSETTALQATSTFGGVRSPSVGYEVVSGLGYYKMIPSALTWQEGREKCQQEGTDIIVVNSEQEADVVRAFINRKIKIPNTSYADYTFLGMHDNEVEGKFITVFGDPLANTGYTAVWRSGEPNGGTTENCVVVTNDMKLVDVPCDRKVFIICEYNA